VRRFVEEGENTARDILAKYRAELEIIAKGLLEYETLSKDEIDALIRGEAISRGDNGDYRPKEPPRRSSVPSSGPGSRPGYDPEPQPGA